MKGLNNQKLRATVPMPVGKINWAAFDDRLDKRKAIAAEPTGKGDLLIIDGLFGRMFRSDEGCVRDEIEEFCRQYREIYRRLEEDPAHMYYECMSYNDLYSLHGIIPSIAGDQWIFPNTEDYQMDFNITLMKEGEWVERFGEPYLIYEPCEWCMPIPGNKECERSTYEN